MFNDAPIIVSTIGIGLEKKKRYCNKCTNNVISCDYNIVNRFYDTHNYLGNAHFH